MFSYHGASPGNTVTITIDGREVVVPALISVAGALLLSGDNSIRRTAVTGSPRGPWCLMGSCYDCLVTIDDTSGCQACTITVREGMRIARPGPLERNTEDPDPWGSGP